MWESVCETGVRFFVWFTRKIIGESSRIIYKKRQKARSTKRKAGKGRKETDSVKKEEIRLERLGLTRNRLRNRNWKNIQGRNLENKT